MGKQDFQDIVTYEQEGVRIIREKKLIDVFYDEGYSPVIWALRDKPLTVKEILEKYNQIVAINAEKKGLKGEARKKKIEETQRSEKTIYRYLKDLENLGIIAKAGQRVVIGKTATENLFCRTARIFLLEDVKEGWWECEESEMILDRVARVIGIDKGGKPPSIDCLSKLMNKVEKLESGDIFRLLDEHYDDISKIILEGTFKENNQLLKALRTIALLKNADKYVEELKKCIG
jgi:hypothetical protein